LDIPIKTEDEYEKFSKAISELKTKEPVTFNHLSSLQTNAEKIQLKSVLSMQRIITNPVEKQSQARKIIKPGKKKPINKKIDY